MINKFFLPVFFFVLVTVSFAQEEIQFIPKGNWVDPIQIPTESQVSKYDVTSGAYYKLIDYQADLENSQWYSHFVFNVLTSGGASNVSQIEISFDSSYQRVQFHQLVIHRRGEKMDRTSDVSFEYIKNEQQLQSNIYTGTVTALAVLEDIRKGDLVEYSYTIVGSNPVFKNGRYYLSILDDINPIDRIFTKVIYPKDQAFDYRLSTDKIKITKTEEASHIALRVDRRDVEALELEETTPPWIIPYAFIEVTNNSSWKSVSEWAMELFSNKEKDRINEVFEEIFYPEFTQEDKINAIIDFVQDEIRYMGIETGIGSIDPFAPNQVIKQRFGDCKDKSLLMSEMLRAIGVSADPVLVNTILMEKIEGHLPSGKMFDHVIVKFEYDGQDYWIDPTFSYQGGDFRSVVTFDYGKVLVVNEETSLLSSMNLKKDISESRVIEHLNVSKGYDQPGELSVITELRGSRADYTRQLLEYYSIRDLADYYKSFYGRTFPTLYETSKLKVSDDIDLNVLVTTENYTLPDLWSDSKEGYDGKYTLDYEPVNVYSYLFSTSCEKKEFPVMYSYPIKFYQETIIDLVDNIGVEREEVTFDNVAFTFSRLTESTTPKQVRIVYEYETKTKEISPSDFPEVCRDINKIVDDLAITFYFSKSTPGLENLGFQVVHYPLTLKDQSLEASNFYIESVVSLLNSNNNVVGVLDIKEKEVTAAVFEKGVDVAIQNFLDKNQKKSTDSGIPVTLTIERLQLSEGPEEAMIEFEYRATYEQGGKTIEYNLVDDMNVESKSPRNVHEHNIRKSLGLLLKKLSENN